MITGLETKHPCFNLAMEVLASLSYEVPARLRDLVEDFGFEGQVSLRKVIQDLRDLGIEIRVAHGKPIGTGDVAEVAPQSWDKARAMAEGYWASVYC